MPVQRKIYYHDTDAGGVVYYANYLKYLEEARTEFLQGLGLGVQPFLDRGLTYAVRYCHIIYRSPARYGDTIACDARVSGLTGAQVVFTQRVWDIADGKTLVEAEVGLVCLGPDFKPRRLPEELKGRMAVL